METPISKTGTASVAPQPMPASKPKDELTPSMRQYLEVKGDYPDCLVFYQMGDFYELFFADAETAAAALNITLTKRGKVGGEDIPMCGVPLHAVDGYLTRLIQQGHRIAICEQTETPAEAKQAKKTSTKQPLNRQVVRVVTPGTLVEDNVLVASENNYLASVFASDQALVVAVADISCGDVAVESLARIETAPTKSQAKTSDKAAGGGSSKLVDSLAEAIARLNPAEVIISDHQPWLEEALSPMLASNCLMIRPGKDFAHGASKNRLCALYQVATLDGIAKLDQGEVSAVGGLVAYLDATQKDRPLRLKPIRKVMGEAFVDIDPATRRSLEITRTLAGEKKGALLASIDKTLTAKGGRLLASRLARPLRSATAIQQRLDLVESMLMDADLAEGLEADLRRMPDIERAFSRLRLSHGGPRDLDAIARGLLVARHIGEVLANTNAKQQLLPAQAQLADLQKQLVGGGDVASRISRALCQDNLPLLARDGGFIRVGFDPALDEFFRMRDESHRHIAKLQGDYATKTGIANLKIKHNNVLGYHIEVKPKQADILLAEAKTKGEFIHRQTTVTGVRFSTNKLNESQRKLAEAGDKARALEVKWFEKLATIVMEAGEAILAVTEAAAILDVALATARLARQWNYCRPQIANDKQLTIIGGRHPVVEQTLANNQATPFITNDCALDGTERMWLITGPNMAGKSTFLRQNALIVIMAQAGLYVPAADAKIGLVDRVFCRVGAADDLASGRSTFMVEMVETAAILNGASKQSLVILDEIGRGTATYDGLSLAWAVIEHLHTTNQARVLFATHYHELATLESRLDGLACYVMQVQEWQGEIVFLHAVKRGAADRSYGIHVARLAGVPDEVIGRAEAVLAIISASNDMGQRAARLPLFNEAATSATKEANQADQHDPSITLAKNLAEAVADLDPDQLTPKTALDKLYALKAMLDRGAKQ